jgi:hypothetical protein
MGAMADFCERSLVDERPLVDERSVIVYSAYRDLYNQSKVANGAAGNRSSDKMQAATSERGKKSRHGAGAERYCYMAHCYMHAPYLAQEVIRSIRQPGWSIP